MNEYQEKKVVKVDRQMTNKLTYGYLFLWLVNIYIDINMTDMGNFQYVECISESFQCDCLA